MRRLNLLTCLIATVFTAAVGQDWRSLEFNPDQPGLEHNPLKGFMTLWNPENDFPRSIQGHSFGLNQVMAGMNSFNWTAVETALNNDLYNGNFSTLQVIIDPADGTTRMPGFLIDQVDWVLKEGSTPSLCPDWNNETLLQALLSFISAFGKKYNDDPRIFTVTLGLYGMWGEWHVGSDKTFEMTPENKSRLAIAYKDAFPHMNLKARYPGTMPDPQIYGYSDGLVFGQSWYFLKQLREAGAGQNWKQHVISGEIDPDLQSTIWKSWPNTEGDNVTAVIDSMHPTHLISHYVLTKLNSGSGEWDNAIRAQKMMGYTFTIDKYRLSSAYGRANVEVEIKNTGVAPMHADWDIEIGAIDSSGHFLSLCTDKWNLKQILPDNHAHYRASTSLQELNDGTYKVLLRIVNPLEVSTANADPVRFANNSQDADLIGWITLGEMTLTGGNCGQPPVRVTGISLEKDTLTLTPGSSSWLSAAVSPENADCKEISWSTDHPYTASVDPGGMVTAGPLTGQAMIYACTQDGGHKAAVVVNVEPAWHEIPSRIEAEDYLDQSGVQIQNCSDTGGGLCVGRIDAGEWMEYPVRNDSDTVYFDVTFRLSSEKSNGSFRLYLDDDMIGQVDVPSNGGLLNWESVPAKLRIGTGDHILKMEGRTGGFMLNYLDFYYEEESGRTPYECIKWHFPGDTVHAWQYDFIHFREDGRFFSLDTAQTIGIYGCNDSSGTNIRVYSDSAGHKDAAQFYWDPLAETVQRNGQWLEYTASFTDNLPYQLLLRARDSVDANFLLSISTPGGELVYSRNVSLLADLMSLDAANDLTEWKTSGFEIDLPRGDYIVRFDWYDQVGEPGIFGGFSFAASSLDLTPPKLYFVTTGNFNIGTYLQLATDEDAKAYLVPAGTATDKDSIYREAVKVVEAKAYVIAYISTSDLNAGEYRFYAIDTAGNLSEPSKIIQLEAVASIQDAPEFGGSISVSYDPYLRALSIRSTNELGTLEIYDIRGRKKVYQVLYRAEESFDLSDFDGGIYLIQVTDVLGNREIVKVLVSRPGK